MKELSRAVQGLERPASVEVAQEAISRAANGEDIVNLGWGEPQFETPEPIREELHAAVKNGNTNYTDSAGIKPLRESIAEKLSETNAIPASPKSIVVTPGAKQAIFLSLRALLDPSDEVIIFDPAWTSYSRIITLAGGHPVPVYGEPDNRFVPTRSDLVDAVSPETKAIIVNTPSNPTGAVLQREELQSIADIARENDLYVIADEVYEAFTFDEHEHHSIASIDGMNERTVTVNGFSKSHAMTGWRLGYLAAVPELREPILTVHQHLNTCATSFVQHAAVTAYNHTGHLSRVRQRYRTNRDVLLDEFRIPVIRPEGAFYALLDVRALDRDETELASIILDETGVALTPGSTYGDAAAGFLRASLTVPTDQFRGAAERLDEWWSQRD